MSGRQAASHWGHHDGLETDLRQCIVGCIHEVTGLKPPRLAVMELLAKQFSQDSFCGFLIPFAKLLLLITVFYFLQGVNDTRDEKKC